MENKNYTFTILKLLSCLILLIFLFSASGCGLLKDRRITTKYDDIELKALEEGYEAFHRGDFHQAANVFKTLHNAENEEISQKALYGLTCSQLILADTPEMEKKAIKRIGIWADSGSFQMNGNDLKMLEVLMEHMLNNAREEKRTKKEIDTTCKHRFQMQLKTKDQQINQLNTKIKAMNGELLLLKNKIKSIEEIDQKIQEKKNPSRPRDLF